MTKLNLTLIREKCKWSGLCDAVFHPPVWLNSTPVGKAVGNRLSHTLLMGMQTATNLSKGNWAIFPPTPVAFTF